MRLTRGEPGPLGGYRFAQENHVVAAMGISDGTTDFRAVFSAMGIPNRWT